MANATQETKLAADYEAVRRRQYELITGLLEIVPRIDGLPADSAAQLRDALFHADHPYMIVFVGPFNAGKSSLINALLGEHDLQSIGPTPTTDKISIVRWGEELTRSRSGEVETIFYPSPLLQKVSFVDTPGLESVFKTHEDITKRFLHRSDTVLLVMLATQAMTQRNLDYLQFLKEYGKNVILILNQIDLISTDEIETVRQYIMEQSREKLGFEPELWLTSTRIAAAARLPDGTLDAVKWQESGLAQIEAFVERQMNDTTRLRQKMQTPMQIVEHVHQEAMTSIKGNQAALDHYQSVAQNIEGQITVCKREQEKAGRMVEDEVRAKFAQVSDRGAAALREQFQLARGLISLARGTLELVGLSGLARASSGGSYIRAAFDKYKVFEAVRELAPTVDKLAPRLEGRDLQDLDDLVSYARKEIEALPPAIRSKVIGTVQPPIKYERSALLNVHKTLEPIQEEAQIVETDAVEGILRNTLLYVAAYELLMVIFIIFSMIAFPFGLPDSPLPILLIVLFGLALLGLAFLPLRGRLLETAYRRRLAAIETRYLEALHTAADRQIAYGLQLRRDAVAPLTRVIEAQTETQMEQMKRLQAAGQDIAAIEAAAASMGKPTFSLLRGSTGK
ncbi:MAG: dynamin family protein [Chloroflexota bacterium]|nr:dynamin family protein [Chloroflexota bacterium]